MFCRGCGREIPAVARFCGYCGIDRGHPQQARTTVPRKSVVLRVLIFVMVCVGLLALFAKLTGPGVWDSDAPSDVRQKDVGAPIEDVIAGLTQVRAAKIVQEYEANEIAADQVYKGRRVFVIGEVGDVKKDILDTPYITLDEEEFHFRAVQAFFPEAMLPELARLQKGQLIGVVGVCDGLMMNVIIKKCQLVHIEQQH